MLLQEAERVVALLVREPGTVPELDQRNEWVEELPDPRELILRLVRLDESRVVLEQDSAQLAGELEWLDRRAELGEGARALDGLVVRHRLRGLHVEDEVGWCPLRPAAGHRGIGKVVEGRVDLDRVEALAVVPEPRGRGRDSAGVPGLDETLVGEAARPDSHRRRHA